MRVPTWAPHNSNEFLNYIKERLDEEKLERNGLNSKLIFYLKTPLNGIQRFKSLEDVGQHRLPANAHDFVCRLVTNPNMNDVWRKLLPLLDSMEDYNHELLMFDLMRIYASTHSADMRKAGEVKRKRIRAIKKINAAIDAIRDCDEPKGSEYGFIKMEPHFHDNKPQREAAIPWNKVNNESGEMVVIPWSNGDHIRCSWLMGLFEPPLYTLYTLSTLLDNSLNTLDVSLKKPGEKTAYRTYLVRVVSMFFVQLFGKPFDQQVASVLNTIITNDFEELSEDAVRHIRASYNNTGA